MKFLNFFKNEKKLNILVVGYTGSGKTSLIQSICGKEIVPDNKIGHAEPTTRETTPYNFGKIVLWDTCGFENNNEDNYVKRITDFVQSKNNRNDISDHIHLCWYCIAGDRARITPHDIRLIKHLFPLTITVILKADLMRKEQFDGINQALIEENIMSESIVFCSNETKAGISKLIDKSNKILPVAYNDCLDKLIDRAKQLREYSNKQADEYIMWASARAAAIAINPIPLAETPFLASNQIYMIYKISACYGIPPTESIVAGFLGAIGASIGGFGVASFFPGLKIVIAAGITFGVGKAAKAYFESNMTIDKDALNKIYEVNKKNAKNYDWKNISK